MSCADHIHLLSSENYIVTSSSTGDNDLLKPKKTSKKLVKYIVVDDVICCIIIETGRLYMYQYLNIRSVPVTSNNNSLLQMRNKIDNNN